MTSTRAHTCIWLALLAALLWSPRAWAGCTVAIPDIAFGNVSLVAGQHQDIVQNMTINCTGYSAAYQYVRVCVSIGIPSGGGSSANDRILKGPNAKALKYNLYTDAARTRVWGSTYISGVPPMIVDVPISWGSGNLTVPFYGRVPAGQANLDTGSYSIAYTASDVEVTAAAFIPESPPASCTAPVQADDTFNINATVIPDCTVSATSIDFGQQGNLGINATATGVVNVTCTYNLQYSLSLGAGQGTGATVAARKLSRSGGAEMIDYRLYTDAARMQPWGDGNAGTSLVYGQGTGNSASHTVYALLPAQASKPPGTYSDTIVVTITY